MSGKIKWCELGPEKTLRNEVLAGFLQKQSLDNEFQFIECSAENLKEQIQKAEKEFDVIRLHPMYFDLASQIIDQSFQEFVRLKTVDTLIKNHPRFWPESLYRDAIFQCLTQKIKDIDVTQKALVIGSCGLARAVAAALIRLGFSKINITSDDFSSANLMMEDFKKIFFNTTFQTTPKDHLTLLPGEHGLVVNTFSFEKGGEFLNDLYYFNFLKKGGWVVDLADIPLETPFIHIAKDINANVISGLDINSFYDELWIQKIFKKNPDITAYKDSLKVELEKAPFDKEKHDKILAEFQV